MKDKEVGYQRRIKMSYVRAETVGMPMTETIFSCVWMSEKMGQSKDEYGASAIIRQYLSMSHLHL